MYCYSQWNYHPFYLNFLSVCVYIKTRYISLEPPWDLNLNNVHFWKIEIVKLHSKIKFKLSLNFYAETLNQVHSVSRVQKE